jgi:hypothetical protein
MSTQLDDAGVIKGRGLLRLIRDKDRAAVEPSYARNAVVTGVSGDLVVARSTNDAGAGEELFAKLAGPSVIVGDPGVLIPLQGGGYAFAKVGGNVNLDVTGTFRQGGRDILLPAGRSFLFDVSAGGGGVATTTSISVWTAQGTRTFDTPNFGTWKAWVVCLGGFKHSVVTTGAVDFRAMATAQTGGTNTITAGTDFTPGYTWTYRSGIPASTSVSYWMDFKANNAGTASSIAPLILVFLERES